jgi:hypothetical protein
LAAYIAASACSIIAFTPPPGSNLATPMLTVMVVGPAGVSKGVPATTRQRRSASALMRGGASLDAYPATRQVGEEFGNLRPSQLAPDSNLARGVDAMDLEHVFGEVETDRGNLHDGRLLFCGVNQRRPRKALGAVQQGPSTRSTSIPAGAYTDRMYA